MRPWNLPGLLLPLALLASAAAQAPDAKSGPPANAALMYWQAFALMPALDKNQERLLEEWDKVPLDAAVRALLAKSHSSLMYLHRGAKLKHCDWGLDYNDGISMHMPHLAKARDLARLAALRARLALAQGHWKAGSADATALMALARHVGRDPIMICLLVRYLIEGMAIELVAAYVPELKAPLPQVVAVYEALPAGVTIQQAFVAEKRITAEWLIKKLNDEEQRKQGAWRDLWQKIFDGPEVPEAVQRVESFAEALRMANDLLPVYDQLAKLVALPRDEFAAQYPEFTKKTKAAYPLAGALVTSADRMLATEHRNQARMAMLFAAIAIAQGGPDKLKDFKDPFGSGPFEYRALDRGFELKSKLLFRDQPVTLTVGQGKKG